MPGESFFDAKFEHKKPTKEEFFSEITDPAKHDPNHYCYIVHGVNPSARTSLLLATMRNEGYDFRQEIDLLNEPHRISEKKIISTSIINQDHNATWGDVFFILDVPWDNFVSMSPRDSATNVTRPDFVAENLRTPEMLPSQLIEQTRMLGGKSAYNEVVVVGKRKESVKIQSVGIRKYDTGGETLRESPEAKRMRQVAKDLGVPVIDFVEKIRIPDGNPEVSLSYKSGLEGKIIRAIYLNFNGHRYCFEGSWDKTEISDIFKGDKNFFGGHNPVTREEWLTVRPKVMLTLEKTKEGLAFLKKIDEYFESGHQNRSQKKKISIGFSVNKI